MLSISSKMMIAASLMMMKRIMDSVIEEQGLDYVFLMLTNILEETTHLLICGPEAEGVIERGFGVTPEDKVAILPGVMSRKKQMIPNLSNAFQQ